MRSKTKIPADAQRLTLLLVVATCVLSIGGCAKPLLSPTADRSQYDRYDRVRNQFVPQYIEDEYGRRTPNIRGRLRPRS